ATASPAAGAPARRRGRKGIRKRSSDYIYLFNRLLTSILTRCRVVGGRLRAGAAGVPQRHAGQEADGAVQGGRRAATQGAVPAHADGDPLQPPVLGFFERLVRAGKPRVQAVGACLRELVMLCYGCPGTAPPSTPVGPQQRPLDNTLPGSALLGGSCDF